MRTNASLQLVLFAFVVAASGCGPKALRHAKSPMPAAPSAVATEKTPASAAKPAAEAKATAQPAEKAPAKSPMKLQDYAGTYTNGGGAVLVISGFDATKGFTFHLRIKSKDDCDTVNYGDTVAFAGSDKATNTRGDVFKLKEGAVDFEPSVEMAGMDCIRVIDTSFVKQK